MKATEAIDAHRIRELRSSLARAHLRIQRAEAKLEKVWALVANGCFSNPDEEQLLTDIRDDLEREW